MNFNKGITITKHALERLESRRVSMTPSQYRIYKNSPVKYIKTILRPDNIKQMRTLPTGAVEVITKSRYVVIIKEGKKTNFVLTVYYRNREKEQKVFKNRGY